MKIWTSLMVATGVVLSFILTCITPFSAIAAFAARTVPLRYAVVAVLGAWAGNQIVGFAFLGYPHTLMTYAWSGFIAIACLAGLAAAWRVGNFILAFAAAFVAYEAVILVFSALTHTLADFTLAPFLTAVEANLTGFIVLAALRAGLVAIERLTHARASSSHAHR